MNSNLFTPTLDTSHTHSFLGIEAMMYQGSNFLVKLAEALKTIKDKGKFDTATVKAAKLNELASKFTGMNVTIQLEPGDGAYMYMPPLDNSHPFHNNFSADVALFSTAGEMILKSKHDPIAEIDYVNATVGGIYSEIPVNVYIGTSYFRGDFTIEEISTIILHELGHAYTYFFYLGRMYFANFLMASYAQEIMGTRDVDRRKILLKAAERRLGIELRNPNALVEQPTLSADGIETLFINSHRFTLANTTGTDIYDFRSCEQLADYFATMHGAGPYLISSLNKMYEQDMDKVIVPFHVYMISQFFTFIWSPIKTTRLMYRILKSNPAIKRYDSPDARAKYIEMQMRGALKNRNMKPEMRKSLLEGIEAAKKEADRLGSDKGIVDLIWNVLSPTYRRGVKQEQSQKVIESIIFNDLYEKAAIFDSIESINPLIDEAATLIAESRQEDYIGETVEVNYNELSSDLDYLNTFAERPGEEITLESFNNVRAIIAKYDVEDTWGLEEYNVVSTEAIGALGIAAITAAVAVVAAVIWKIIKWISEKSDSSQAVNEKANEASKVAVELAKSQPSREAASNTVKGITELAKPNTTLTTKPKAPAQNSAVKHPGQQKPDEASKNIAGITNLNANLKVGELDVMVRRAFKEVFGNSISKEEFTLSLESNQMYRVYFKPDALPAISSARQFELIYDNVSFVKLAKFFGTFRPDLSKRYKLIHNESTLGELREFLKTFTSTTPNETVKNYLESRTDLSIPEILVNLGSDGYNDYINKINNDGKFLIKAVQDMKQFLDPAFVSRIKTDSEVPTVISLIKEYITRNSKNLITAGAGIDKQTSKSSTFAFYGQYASFHAMSYALSDTQIFKDFLRGKPTKFTSVVDKGVCVDAISAEIKELQAIAKKDHAALYKAYLSKAEGLTDKMVVNQVTDHITKLIKLLTDYEQQVANTMIYARVVSRNMERILAFNSATTVICAEFEAI